MIIAPTVADLRPIEGDSRAPSIDFVATLLTAVLHPRRLLWSRQIEQSNDRTQSVPDFHLGGLQNVLEELLGVPVGLVTPGDLPKRFRGEVLAKAMPI